MKKFLALILNLPWSIVGIIFTLVSLPIGINNFNFNFVTLLINVKRVWLIEIFYGKRIKGVTLGNIILLSNIADEATIKHELVHSKQYINNPFIFIILYFIELIKHGYQENIYEIEARRLS